MNLRKLELPLVLLVLLGGSAFLLKMCYLSLVFNTLFGVIFLTIVYGYVRARHSIHIPLVLLALVFAALQVDALGNYFRLYGHQFGPMQYDEFAHMTVQVLVTPVIVWLARQLLDRIGYQVPLTLTAFFAATTIFSLSAFYEIIELWDEVYFNGQRIWGPHDTANDLQWDLIGIVVGTLLAHLLLSGIVDTHHRSTEQPLHWDRGRLARNERAARTLSVDEQHPSYLKDPGSQGPVRAPRSLRAG